MPKERPNRNLCTWAIPNFPRVLKTKFAAACRVNEVFMRERLEYLVGKDVRESGITSLPFKKGGQDES